MDALLLNKYNLLKQFLLEKGKVAVAFSFGVDSSLLLKTAFDTLGDNSIAIICKHASFQNEEFDGAVSYCEDNGINYEVIEFDSLAVAEFVNNDKDRCYYCKKALMTKLKAFADNNGYLLCEGTNADDCNDYRPGARALAELGIVSPLRDLGFSKNDIRAISKELGLITYNKPSLSCLATRIAYGEIITSQKLDMIYKAEQYLLSLGFSQLRVRLHNNLARIELLPNEFVRFTDEVRVNAYKHLKELGFTFVALDLQGYYSGSMNEEIK